MSDTNDFILKKNGEIQIVPLTFINVGSDGIDDYEVSDYEGCEFLTIPEIVEDLLTQRLCQEDKDFLVVPDEQRDMEHAWFEIELGRWIRNSYGMWLNIHPNTNVDDVNSDFHPDQYSHQVIVKMKEMLTTLNQAQNAIDIGNNAIEAFNKVFDEGKRDL